MALKSKEKIEITVKSLDDKLKLGLDQVGNQIAVLYGRGNPKTNHISARSFRKLIIKEGKEHGYVHTRREIESIQEIMGDLAEASDNELQVYLRVASIGGGIELDVGDKEQTRIRLTAGNVEVISEGSDVLFYRPEALRPFVMPAENGSKYGLFEYLNLETSHAWLLIVWICYVLSTPRSDVNSYPILVLIAEQGAAKSTTCKLIIRSLLDPNQLGIQGFPDSRKDMVIASNQAAVLIYDNLRYVSKKWSDILCIASTGGTDPTRRLYTDDELMTHPFKVPLVLNGIHDFIEEPDLASRCVTLRLNPIPEDERRDEKEFTDEFNAVLPELFRGVLDLTANILERLPAVKVIHPERMLGYVRYLAAAEEAMEMPPGRLQAVYSGILNDSQRDSVLEDALASTVYEMVTEGRKNQWSGSPTELLEEIMDALSDYDPKRRLLPNNPISLSKRLNALKAPLRSQGVDVALTRGKSRRITLTNLEASS